MIKIKQLVLLLGCVSTMCGCAGYQARDKQAFDIRPVMEVKHTSDLPGAMYQLGRYYQGKARYAEAIAAYEKTLAKDPGHADAHNGLGVSYSLRGEHELALEHFRKAIELAPLATHLRNNVGYALLMRGQGSEAAAEFQQALQLDPENLQARSNLAAVYKKLGVYDKGAVATVASRSPSIASPASSAMLDTQSVLLLSNGTTLTTNQYKSSVQLVKVAPDVFEFRTAGIHPMTMILTTKTTGKASSHSSSKRGERYVGVEVSNGNGISGIAKQFSNFLQKNGFEKARLTDRPPFHQAQTEIHYRSGHHVLADQISQMLPEKQARTVESNNLRRDIHVRVLLGKDIAREIAYFKDSGKG